MNERTDELTESLTPISHLAISRCDKNAYNVLFTHILFTNDKNKNIQNVSIFCYHGNKTIEPSAILPKRFIFKRNYLHSEKRNIYNVYKFKIIYIWLTNQKKLSCWMMQM